MCSCLDGSSVFLDRSVTRVGNYHRLGGKSNFFEFDRAMEEAKRNRYVDIGDDEDEEVMVSLRSRYRKRERALRC